MERPATLPDSVLVLYPNGDIERATVIGQRLPFPRIVLRDGGTVEVCWQTLVSCASQDRPVHI